MGWYPSAHNVYNDGVVHNRSCMSEDHINMKFDHFYRNVLKPHMSKIEGIKVSLLKLPAKK